VEEHVGVILLSRELRGNIILLLWDTKVTIKTGECKEVFGRDLIFNGETEMHNANPFMSL